jgi:N-acetylmuramoyl-L-alanine amidase
MRKINEIFVHCSATPEGKDYTVADIDKWHKQRGFSQVGYHYVVYRDGTVHDGRPVEKVGAHARGHNRNSIGICYIGGVDGTGTPKDTRTEEQCESIENLLYDMVEQYPGAKIRGHNEVSAKACPSFKVDEEYGHIGKTKRRSIAQSTTVQASGVAIASGAGTAISTVSGLDANAQYIVLVFAGLIVLAGLWIMRERLKKWANGDR